MFSQVAFVPVKTYRAALAQAKVLIKEDMAAMRALRAYGHRAKNNRELAKAGLPTKDIGPVPPNAPPRKRARELNVAYGLLRGRTILQIEAQPHRPLSQSQVLVWYWRWFGKDIGSRLAALVFTPAASVVSEAERIVSWNKEEVKP